jgi:hypothetical protein
MSWNKRRLAGLLTLPLWLVPLASCAPQTNSACIGWAQVQLAGPSIDYLASHDPQALAPMIGNQLYGVKIGCWK